MAELARLLGRFAEIAEENVEILRQSIDATRAGTYSSDQFISNSVTFWLNINEALQVPFESLETTVFLTSVFGDATAVGYSRNPVAGNPVGLTCSVLTPSLTAVPPIPIADITVTLVGVAKYLKVAIQNLNAMPAATYTGTVYDGGAKEVAKIRLTIL